MTILETYLNPMKSLKLRHQKNCKSQNLKEKGEQTEKSTEWRKRLSTGDSETTTKDRATQLIKSLEQVRIL